MRAVAFVVAKTRVSLAVAVPESPQLGVLPAQAWAFRCALPRAAYCEQAFWRQRRFVHYLFVPVHWASLAQH